jgi:zinc transport system ATP-binding protein
VSERSSGGPAVHVDALHVQLGATTVLEGIDLAVPDGQTLALLGANGSGKTTLVRTLLGLVPATKGQVTLYGAAVSARRSVPWSRIGYVPQRVNANPSMTVTAEEVVAAGLLDNRRLLPGPRARERVQNALDQVGLRERSHESVQLFSGGQQQRVLIARALVRQPDLLVIDEPMSGIDQESQTALALTLSELQNRGTTIVVVLHDPGVLAPLIHRTVILDQGRIIHDGTLAAQDSHRPSSGPATSDTDAVHYVPAAHHDNGVPSPGRFALDLTTAWPR